MPRFALPWKRIATWLVLVLAAGGLFVGSAFVAGRARTALTRPERRGVAAPSFNVWAELSALFTPADTGPWVSDPVPAGLSPAARDLPPATFVAPTRLNEAFRENPEPARTGFSADVPGWVDPLLKGTLPSAAPAPIISVAGIGNFAGVSPPDTVGAVGDTQYVQMVNATRFTVLNKNGTTLLAPTNMSALWSSGNCAASSDGDPMVVYDNLADRWLLAQFSTGNGVCVAVSQTNDATGAYYTYEFNTPDFPDYFKIGVWGDAYYMSANENSYTAYAFDRAKMLAGQAATSIRFSGQDNLLMPASFTGNIAPPAGTPGYFYTFKDDAFHGGADRLEIFEFRPNWATPASSTFVLTNTIPVSNFTYTVCGFFVLSCIPQGGTTRKVDPVSEWPMWQLQYRNLGTHQALVSNFAVDVGSDRAGIRWFELRRTTGAWALYQEGTHAPEADKHYWMGSMGMDKQGNIALGYSVSNASMNPALRYTVREATDPLGTLQTEAVLVNGTGSQTGSNRWGDYSALTVDPADDCTFWFTSEYFVTSSSNGWATRIGKFVLPGCLNPPTPAIVFTKTVSADTCLTPTNTLTVTAGAVVNYCFNVTNTGNVTLTTHTLADAMLGVNLTFPLTLTPGMVAGPIAVPYTASVAGTFTNTATFTATYGANTASDSDSAVLVVQPVPVTFGVVMAPAALTHTVTPGAPVTFTVWVTNTGSASDTFTLTLSAGGFTGTLSAPSLTLAAGAGANVAVTATAPASLAPQTWAHTLTATSQGNGITSASATLTLQVNPWRLFLPLARR